MSSVLKQIEIECFRHEGLFNSLDLEVCRFLQAQDAGVSDAVLLAAGLTSYYYRQGNICLPLSVAEYGWVAGDYEGISGFELPPISQWVRELRQSELVGEPGDFKPLILDHANRLYLHKLWKYEQQLADNLLKRADTSSQQINRSLLKDSLERLFPKEERERPDWQKIAAITSVYYKLSIISGGPGTGKTTTVVRILALLIEQYMGAGDTVSIALAAPTGKAAARLKDAISSAKSSLNVKEKVRSLIPEETKTIHQLLGARRQSAKFRYNRNSPLPNDLVIIDEASMIDQALMSKLMAALLDNARLIILGDKDQLSSVEAGSVMGDICAQDINQLSEAFSKELNKFSVTVPSKNVTCTPQKLTDHITLLTKSYRFEAESGILPLAEAVNQGDAERALKLLKAGEGKGIELISPADSATFNDMLDAAVSGYFQAIRKAPAPEEALRILNTFKILAVHRKGPLSVTFLNQAVEQILRKKGWISRYREWYEGKPVIINHNDYALNLFNGDTGLCLMNEQREPAIFFQTEQILRSIPPSRLPGHNTAFALTVHKSQGSEFDEIMLILPAKPSPILSRELIYTAITRAKNRIKIVGNEWVFAEGIKTKRKRTSGLKDYLWD